MKATDADVGSNADITYRITGGNSESFFAINISAGIISTTAQLDFEKTPAFNLTVSASDSKFTTFVSVIIEVVNENDNDPSFPRPMYYANVAENSAVVTSVVIVIASDVDPFGQLTYSIESVQPGNHSDAFSIDLTSGLISTADVLDREMIDSYVITVKATDGGKPSRHGFTSVIVNVTDTNDNPPVFNSSSVTAVISEASAVSTHVTKITATQSALYYFKQGMGKRSQDSHDCFPSAVLSSSFSDLFLLLSRTAARYLDNSSTDRSWYRA